MWSVIPQSVALTSQSWRIDPANRVIRMIIIRMNLLISTNKLVDLLIDYY